MDQLNPTIPVHPVILAAMSDPKADMTTLLTNPDAATSSVLLSLVYDQLRKVAQQHMSSERRDHTLQATALVHEAYAGLVGDEPVSWANRGHFFAAAADAMRRILIEHARGRARLKRGGDAAGSPRRRVSLDVIDLAAEADPDEILSVE